MNKEEAREIIAKRGGLRRCPFCGGKAELRPKNINDDIDEFYIKCTKCRAKSMRSVLLINAVEAWNARVNTPTIVIKSKKFKKWMK